MTSSKLVRMEDAIEILKADRRFPYEALSEAIAKLRALPAGGAETPALCETLPWVEQQIDTVLEWLGIARTPRHNGDRLTILGYHVAKLIAEKRAPQAEAAERDSVVGKAARLDDLEARTMAAMRRDGIPSNVIAAMSADDALVCGLVSIRRQKEFDAEIDRRNEIVELRAKLNALSATADTTEEEKHEA